MEKYEKEPITNDLIREIVELTKSTIGTTKRYSIECSIGQSFAFKSPRVIVTVYDMLEMRCNVVFMAMCYESENLTEAIDKVREFLAKDGESE